MASAFPHHPPVDHTPRKQTHIRITVDDQTGALTCLSSETAQAIIGQLCEEPGTMSEIAEAVGTSVQNVQYHLERLAEPGLVDAIDTWYSAKGKQMAVYALTTEELVIQFGKTS